MLRNQKIIAAGYALAPLTLMLLWVDLTFTYQWLLVALFFGLLPLLRLARPVDLSEGIDDGAIPNWLAGLLYWLPAISALIWLATLAVLPYAISLQDKSLMQIVVLWVCVWVASSLALPACHELVHRKGLHGILGRALSASLGMVGFTEEHRLHHMKSGHGADLDCAEQDDNIYAYSVRTAVSGFRAAWDYERVQQLKEGRRAWTNRIAWASVVPACYAAVWAWALGASGVLFYVLIAAGSIFSFRAITYIQHWGLRQVPFERNGQATSWVSTCVFQSWIIYNLALHEHHHVQPGIPYWRLASKPTDLRLPTTYPLAFLICLVPPLHRKLMAPRLAQWLQAMSDGRPLAQQEMRCIT